MPMKRELYPPNWDQIALRIKERAGWFCEQCGRPCRKPKETIQTFWQRIVLGLPEWLHGGPTAKLLQVIADKPQVWTLTVAHLDHNPANCADENLRAWCSGCHCRYDAPRKGQDRRDKAKRKHGQVLMGGLE